MNELSVLIVEDSPEDCETYKRLLDRGDGPRYRYRETDTVHDAMQRCREAPPDCMLLDINLPGDDGLVLLEALAREDGLRDIPVVVLTGHGNEALAVESMKRGASDYLSKDHVSAESLGRAVAYALEKAALRRRIERKRQEMEMFAALAAHDLQAPLRSISQFAALLRARHEGALDAKGRQYLDFITRGADDLSGLVEDLLRYAAVGARDQAPVAADLGEALERALDDVAADVERTGAEITADPLPVVLGHPVELRRLLQNLIENAVKYCEGRRPRVHVSARRVGDAWEVAVRDNGIGIAKEHLQTIFVPLKRLHADSRFRGTGLGLAICRKIVEHHGGEIRAASTVGEGSVFWFTVAAVRPGESAA